jgi:hypothetical protein
MTAQVPTQEITVSIDGTMRLGDLLAALKYADRERIDAAAASAKAAGNSALLGQTLVKDGVCSQAQVEFAAKLQKHLRDEHKRSKQVRTLTNKSFIGQILVAMGLAEYDAVEGVFDKQKAERDAGRIPPVIGEMLIAEGVCTEEARDFGMDVQNALKAVK